MPLVRVIVVKPTRWLCFPTGLTFNVSFRRTQPGGTTDELCILKKIEANSPLNTRILILISADCLHRQRNINVPSFAGASSIASSALPPLLKTQRSVASRCADGHRDFQYLLSLDETRFVILSRPALKLSSTRGAGNEERRETNGIKMYCSLVCSGS